MPIIAMYVMERFGASSSLAGVVVASYIITALLMRPFSGFLVDKYDRKKLYITTYVIFSLLFIGYIIANSITMLIITRILLGATFAVITTAGNTIAIDVVPSQRRAEGIGYFGALIVISMAIGPMAGLYLKELLSYQGLFSVAFVSCCIGVIAGSFVKTRKRESKEVTKLSLDRFFLFDGVSMAIIMSLIYFLYGTLMAYVSIYVKECDVDCNSGNFFMLFAFGIIVSRALAGRYLARGLNNILIVSGLIAIIAAGSLFTLYLTNVTFVISSFILGGGFGIVAPSVQSMIIDLVPHNKRGTANSTYFIALDLGSGLGMLTGGAISHIGNGFQTTYLVGLTFSTIALITYTLFSRKDYAMKLAKSKINE